MQRHALNRLYYCIQAARSVPEVFHDIQVLISPYSVQATGAEASSLEEGAEATDAPVDTNDGEEADEATLAKQMALEEMRKLRQDPRYDASFYRHAIAVTFYNFGLLGGCVNNSTLTAN